MYADLTRHGYVRTELTRDRSRADLRTLENVTSRAARIETVATFVVEAGCPGGAAGLRERERPGRIARVT
jgi:hypothetical protein